MKVAVGSTNPVKITAVSNMFLRVWADAEVVSVAVPSGVTEMPMTDEETRIGACNRAMAAREAVNADFGVGLEGGVQSESFGLVLHGWVVIVDRNGRIGIGGCPRIQLPEHIARRVLAGEELGPVMDDVLDDHNIKQKGGAVGALTANLVLREEAFTTAVAYALGPFVSVELYEDGEQGK